MVNILKLVRDKIPDLIKKEGKNCSYSILDDKRYPLMLNAKLKEEVDEYLYAKGTEEKVEELVDIVEVVYATLNNLGVSLEQFEEIRKEKLNDRGGFSDKIFLRSVD